MPLFVTNRSSCALLVCAAATSGLAMATEIELTIPLVGYQQTETDTDLDDGDVETKTTDTTTVAPDFSIEIFADDYLLGIDIDASGASKSGAIRAGCLVRPNLYAGLAVGKEDSDSEVEIKVDGGATTDVDTEQETSVIGPFVHYRSRADKATIEAHALLAQFKSKSTGEDDLTSTYEMLGLSFGGDYLYKVADRVHIGAGLDYTLSLSGDAEIETEGDDQDGDLDYTQLDLTLLQVRMEL